MNIALGIIIGASLVWLAMAGIFASETRREVKRLKRQLKGEW